MKNAIEQAGIAFTIKESPICLGGEAFSDIVEEMNRNYSFECGAEWMLDKACKWMNDIDFDRDLKDGSCKEAFINAFRKAMEE